MGCAHGVEPLTVTAPRGRHLVVDLHCHILIEPAERLAREAGVPAPPSFASPASRAASAASLVAVRPQLTDLALRLRDMDMRGVDIQALSPVPAHFCYEAEPGVGRDITRAVNEGIAAAVSRHPDRLVGMGTVPLQSVELAVAEMRRCVGELGFRGIEIATNVRGEELSDPKYRPFFAAAEELGIVLFLHATGYSHGERLCDFLLNTVIGAPFDATVALSQLIFSGTLARHPGLKLCVAHGGGFLPGYWGRLDRAYQIRADCRAHIDEPPSAYLRRVWADTLVFDPAELAALVAAHGADRLCMGTDYPFELGEADPLAFHAGLAPAEQARILGGNAAELLGLIVAERGQGET